MLSPFAVKVRERQSSDEAAMKEVHSIFHVRASTPEGPAAPLVCTFDCISINRFKENGMGPHYRQHPDGEVDQMGAYLKTSFTLL